MGKVGFVTHVRKRKIHCIFAERNKYAKNAGKKGKIGMDLFIILRDLVITISNNLPPALTNFILRLGILLVLSTILLASAWLYLPNKSIFSQTAVGFFAFVISLYLPVERVREAGEGVLAFTVIVSFLCIVFLPEWLPAFLVPRYGDRLKLKKVLKWTIWLLFLVQVIIGVISDG